MSVQVGQTVITGKIVGVGQRGELLLVDDSGSSHALLSGEVTKVNF